MVGELFKNDVFEKEAVTKEHVGLQSGEDLYSEWSTAIEAADDSDLYFSPQQGNVVFASAADGWAFRYILIHWLFCYQVLNIESLRNCLKLKFINSDTVITWHLVENKL